MANNDRQSVCLIFNNAFYLYRTRLLSLYSENKCAYKKHWHILHTTGFMITELSRLKKKGSKRGRESDHSNEHCRENCIPKQPRKIFCRDLRRCLTKTQHSAPCSYRDCALKNAKMHCYSPAPHTGTVDTFDVHITRIKSLGTCSFHHCSDGVSANKTTFLRGYCG